MHKDNYEFRSGFGIKPASIVDRIGDFSNFKSLISNALLFFASGEKEQKQRGIEPLTS